MKLFLSSLFLGAAFAEELTLDAGSLADYKQVGNSVKCLGSFDDALGQSGGPMDIASDSLEMCASVCDCKQGCVSFNWVKFTGFDGKPDFVVNGGGDTSSDQGKCTLASSDCSLAANQEAGTENSYAFARKTGTPTDVQIEFPRSDGADGEKEVTDQVACVLAGAPAEDGYVKVGGGGAFPGVCASGGRYAKLENLDQSEGGTFASCKAKCDGSDECAMFNLDTLTGVCKFRNQRCKTQWVTNSDYAPQPYTTYVKGVVTAETPGDSDAGDSELQDPASFSGAASTAVTTTAAMLTLALILA